MTLEEVIRKLEELSRGKSSLAALRDRQGYKEDASRLWAEQEGIIIALQLLKKVK